MQGKNIANNAANFVGVLATAKLPSLYSYRVDDKDGGVLLAAGWGMQRALVKRITYQLQAGPGVSTNFKTVGFIPYFKIGFSYFFQPGFKGLLILHKVKSAYQ